MPPAPRFCVLAYPTNRTSDQNSRRPPPESTDMVSSDCLSAIWLYVLLACFGPLVHGVPGQLSMSRFHGGGFSVPFDSAIRTTNPMARPSTPAPSPKWNIDVPAEVTDFLSNKRQQKRTLPKQHDRVVLNALRGLPIFTGKGLT